MNDINYDIWLLLIISDFFFFSVSVGDSNSWPDSKSSRCNPLNVEYLAEKLGSVVVFSVQGL